ncbi:nitroreductase family protein [Pseudoflavonifractor sp. 524-17]|uniref:nitroreductase family protein n=1 Tax=Pseudoflavonifractor sp. 524-17 TaxID=2304577 RepID=UPI00137AE2CD|nr:nitroreductase family protein [Pseudoflavonifractor sp. 524-17]
MERPLPINEVNVMDFFEAAAKRYSHRTPFLDQPVPDEDVRKIVTAGIQAPSGQNCQTTSFVVVTDPALRKAISEQLATPATQTAPVILVVLSEHVVAPCGLPFEVEDYAAAVENMLLAATALGYATVWMDGMTKAPAANAAIAKLLNAPQGKTVRTILPLGVPAEVGEPKPRKAFDERVHYNAF